MRPQKVSDTDLFLGLTTVLKTKGYDGASLNDLADATGLKKASLYHRFPGGKKEITQMVLNQVEAWLKDNILRVLTNRDEKPMNRLSTALNNFQVLYEDGKAVCILRALSIGNGLDLFGAELRNAMEIWIDGFVQLGLDLGMTKEEAGEKATNVLISIQGSLVVANNLGTPEIFNKTLSDISAMYKK